MEITYNAIHALLSIMKNNPDAAAQSPEMSSRRKNLEGIRSKLLNMTPVPKEELDLIDSYLVNGLPSNLEELDEQLQDLLLDHTKYKTEQERIADMKALVYAGADVNTKDRYTSTFISVNYVGEESLP